jgi:cytochrome c-type biogenesis protein CcmH/NrfF
MTHWIRTAMVVAVGASTIAMRVQAQAPARTATPPAAVGAATQPAQGTPSAPAATAQPDARLAAGEVHPEAAALIDQIMSPFCPGLILTNCPSLSADSLRRAIRERFAAGASREQVMKELTATYGEAIRSAPDRSGFGLIAWVVPGGLVLVGGLLLTAFIRRRRDAETLARANLPTSAPRAPDSALDAELAARLRDG